jgi:hypothetical protein
MCVIVGTFFLFRLVLRCFGRLFRLCVWGRFFIFGGGEVVVGTSDYVDYVGDFVIIFHYYATAKLMRVLRCPCCGAIRLLAITVPLMLENHQVVRLRAPHVAIILSECGSFQFSKGIKVLAWLKLVWSRRTWLYSLENPK